MKNVQLTHTHSQELGNRDSQTDLSITVDYNPEDRTVERIVSVYAFNWKNLVTTDITHILAEQFDQALDSMIDSIDWPEVYRMEREEEHV